MAVTAGTVYESVSASVTHSVAYPASPTSGDLLVCVAASSGNYFGNGLSVSGSFTGRVTLGNGGPGGDLSTYVWTKVSDGTETGTETVTILDSLSDHLCGYMFKITGDDYGSYDTATSTLVLGSSNTHAAPAATAAGSDNLVLRFCSLNNILSTWTTTPGTQIAVAVDGGSNAQVNSSYALVASKTVPTVDFVTSNTSNGTSATVVIARAAAGATLPLIIQYYG